MKTIHTLIILLFITGCCSDESSLVPGQDFIPDDILEDIIENGQTINDGFSPPELIGTYHVSPLTFVESNFDDTLLPGHIFADWMITFSDYDPDNLTLNVKIEQGRSEGEARGSFITGEADRFTVYVEVNDIEDDGSTSLLTNIISGTLEPTGIRDIDISLFMVDDHGDRDNDLIENGQGRRAIDGDGFSPLL